IILESEPNNSLITADFCGNYNPPGDSFIVDGGIGELRDEDWFQFSVSGPSQIVASTYGRPDSNPPADSFLELFDSAGNLVAFDDDSGINNFSSLSFNTATGGTFFFRVTAFQNQTTFDYKLVVGMNIVPAPASLAALAVGVLGFGRRRR
ncbi:MAG: PPC domain-containing protein, partial [Planctomycetota bacterium]